VFEDGVAQMQCPRCGAKYRTEKNDFEEWKKREVP
jgi:uncharacterized C2H2 Zn-finger protein